MEYLNELGMGAVVEGGLSDRANRQTGQTVAMHLLNDTIGAVFLIVIALYRFNCCRF